MALVCYCSLLISFFSSVWQKVVHCVGVDMSGCVWVCVILKTVRANGETDLVSTKLQLISECETERKKKWKADLTSDSWDFIFLLCTFKYSQLQLKISARHPRQHWFLYKDVKSVTHLGSLVIKLATVHVFSHSFTSWTKASHKILLYI